MEWFACGNRAYIEFSDRAVLTSLNCWLICVWSHLIKKPTQKMLRLLRDIDEELQSKVISVLQPFENVRGMYSDKCPSVHLVKATKVHLQMHLTSNGRDSANIGQMKPHLMTRQYCCVTMTGIHAAATVLDSRLRNNADVCDIFDFKTRGISTLWTSKNGDRMRAEWTRWKWW